LATGHYAHVLKSNDKYKLLRAKDLQKDQSYVLSIMNQDQLSHAIFPLGKYTKKEVRDIAHKRALPVADRQESQDLCFVGQQDYRSFLIGHTSQPPSPGPILDMYEQPIGEHDGLAFYTIGQRKGLGISHPHPLYVIEKRVQQNALLVGPREALGRIRFRIAKMNWISGSAPSSERALTVRVRYKAPEVPANLTMLNAHTAEVLLDNPLPDITPGQSAVFYSGEECLGGGIIQS
jgi:tRNA-specific 2-thiouridylase